MVELDVEQILVLSDLFRALFKVCEVEQAPLKRVALVLDAESDGIVTHLAVDMAEGLAAILYRYDLREVDRVQILASVGDEAEFVVLFGVLKPQGHNLGVHLLAASVGEIYLDRHSLADGGEDDAETLDIALVGEIVAVPIFVVDVIIIGSEERLDAVKALEINAEKLDARIKRNRLEPAFFADSSRARSAYA